MALRSKKKGDDVKETVEITVDETKTKEVPVKFDDTSKEVSTASALSKVFIDNDDLKQAALEAEYGTFPAVVASNGSHMAGDEDLGKVLEFQVISVKKVWKVVPGSTDEEASDYFRVSYDGEVCTDGTSVKDAVDEAHEAGYSKAAVKNYLDMTVIVTDCDNEDYVGEVVVLQLAPTSQYTWRPLEGKLKVQAALGKLKTQEVIPGFPAVIFRSTAEPRKWKGNNFTAFKFEIA